MIEVSRLKDLNAAELFLGFRIRAVSRRDFAVFPVQGHGGLRRLKRYFGNQMSVGAQMVVVLKALVEHCVSLVLGHPFECAWLDVSQTDVFHRFFLVSGSGSVRFRVSFTPWLQPGGPRAPLEALNRLNGFRWLREEAVETATSFGADALHRAEASV
jgi:hypothetical protein